MIKNNLLAFIFLLFISTSSWSTPKINVKTAILLDYNSDKILYELEPDLEIYPASMTKIMTSIIAFDLLKQLFFLIIIQIKFYMNLNLI